MSKKKNKNIEHFFDLQKKSFSKCLHVGFDCKSDAIRAHSIRNPKVPDILQAKNHVLRRSPCQWSITLLISKSRNRQSVCHLCSPLSMIKPVTLSGRL